MKARCEIVAEAGINHSGDMIKALEMVRTAKLMGADTVKFQLVDPNFYPEGTELYEIFKRTYLSAKDHWILKQEADRIGIKYLCTPSDVNKAMELVEQVGVNRLKVASDSADNDIFLDYMKKTGFEIIISTGGLTDKQKFKTFVEHLADWKERVTVLHCVSKYPCPDKDADLSRITGLGMFFPRVGYSDHTQGIQAAPIAVALGAQIIEKHFKLDEEGVDAPLSLLPGDFWQMVKLIRNAESML